MYLVGGGLLSLKLYTGNEKVEWGKFDYTKFT